MLSARERRREQAASRHPLAVPLDILMDEPTEAGGVDARVAAITSIIRLNWLRDPENRFARKIAERWDRETLDERRRIATDQILTLKRWMNQYDHKPASDRQFIQKYGC